MTTIESGGVIHFVPPKRPRVDRVNTLISLNARAQRAQKPLLISTLDLPGPNGQQAVKVTQNAPVA